MMAEDVVRFDVKRQRVAESRECEATVLIHYDGVTPDQHVTLQLQEIFGLSDELAEHIAWVARTTGFARVVTRPRDEAERLVSKVHAAAQLRGFPVTFSLEKDVCIPKRDSRKAVIRFAVSSIILLFALLLALCVAVADGAGDLTSRDITPHPGLEITYEQFASPHPVILDTNTANRVLELADDDPSAEVYRWLRANKNGASTSPPSVGDFVRVYARVGREASGIVSIHVSPRLSAAFNTAAAASRLVDGVPIRVLNCRTAAMGQGFVALEAARAAADGAELDAVVARASKVASKMNLLATIGKLEYLWRGGRIGGAATLLGTVSKNQAGALPDRLARGRVCQAPHQAASGGDHVAADGRRSN